MKRTIAVFLFLIFAGTCLLPLTTSPANAQSGNDVQLMLVVSPVVPFDSSRHRSYSVSSDDGDEKVTIDRKPVMNTADIYKIYTKKSSDTGYDLILRLRRRTWGDFAAFTARHICKELLVVSGGRPITRLVIKKKVQHGEMILVPDAPLDEIRKYASQHRISVDWNSQS